MHGAGGGRRRRVPAAGQEHASTAAVDSKCPEGTAIDPLDAISGIVGRPFGTTSE